MQLGGSYNDLSIYYNLGMVVDGDSLHLMEAGEVICGFVGAST
jgi:hypothetical protein